MYYIRIAYFDLLRINLHPANCHPLLGKVSTYDDKPLNEALLMNGDTSNRVRNPNSLSLQVWIEE